MIHEFLCVGGERDVAPMGLKDSKVCHSES